MKPPRRLIASLLAGLGVVAAPAPARAGEPATRFGVIASTQGRVPDTAADFIRLYNGHRARYGGAPIGIRLFSPGRLPMPGDRTMAGELLTWAAANHSDELITVSHKERDDARLRAFLDWVEAKGLRVSVIYFHEVQDDWGRSRDRRANPDVYRAVYRAYRAVIDAHPARRRVTLEKNLMWWWEHFPAQQGRPGGWRSYVERNDPADVLSWDTYVFPGMRAKNGRYATPDEFFRYALKAWREYGLRWGIGEIGTRVQDGRHSEEKWDADGRKFAAWVREIVDAAADPASIGPDYRGMPPARFVKWWGALDAADNDLSLEQHPAAVAYYRTRAARNPL